MPGSAGAEREVCVLPSILARRGAIIGILFFQVVPLLLFPPTSFSPNSQEWWLPVLLAALVLIADAEVIGRHSLQLWPWHLMIFSQGFNIISRLMMVWSHATLTVGGTTVANVPYLAATLAAMALSALLLWYLELPVIRMGLLREAGS
jgi:hypothetical protein